MLVVLNKDVLSYWKHIIKFSSNYHKIPRISIKETCYGSKQ